MVLYLDLRQICVIFPSDIWLHPPGFDVPGQRSLEVSLTQHKHLMANCEGLGQILCAFMLLSWSRGKCYSRAIWALPGACFRNRSPCTARFCGSVHHPHCLVAEIFPKEWFLALALIWSCPVQGLGLGLLWTLALPSVKWGWCAWFACLRGVASFQSYPVGWLFSVNIAGRCCNQQLLLTFLFF